MVRMQEKLPTCRFQWLCILLVIMYWGTCIVQYLYCTNHLKFTSGEIKHFNEKRLTIVLYMLYVLREELNWYILPVALLLPLESQPLGFTSSGHVLPNLVIQVINSQIYFLSISFHFTFVSSVEKYCKLKIRYYADINFISCRP